MKAIEYFKQNALNIAGFFGFSGAALFALLGEGASMAAEYPAPAAALAVAALCLGAGIGNAVAKRRARKELHAERERLEAEIKSAKASCAKRLAAAQAAYGQALAELQADYDALTSKRAAKLDKLARIFECMPMRRKRLVSKALDKGEALASAYDQDALTLCEQGIFGVPPIVSRTSAVSYSLQPNVAPEIREHRSEWLGM